ncbi:protein sel-1 homolog 3-like isoform X3 [Lithobates pipiens]
MAPQWRVQETLLCCLLLCQSCWMQVITSETSAPTPTKSYIEFFDPPRTLSDSSVIEILYQCQPDQVVHVDVLASSITKPLVGIFKRRWTCRPDGTEKIREIRLNFPDQMVYREDWILRRPIYVTDVLLRAWISDPPIDLNIPDRSSYRNGVAKILHQIEIPTPNSRPYKDHRKCPQWDQHVLWKVRMEKVPQCPAEEEVVRLLPFLYACTGEGFGIVRRPEPYLDPGLERRRQYNVMAPRCSFSIWLYVMDRCPVSLCGVFYHLDDTNDYVTPALLMAKSGHLHVQVELIKKEAHAFRSSDPLPLNQWCHILLNLDVSWANLTVVCGSSVISTTYRFPDHVLLSDVSGTFHLGGCKYVRGIKAFYGPSIYYRNKMVAINKAPPPQMIERMELAQWYRKCTSFQDECATRFQHFSAAEQETKDCGDPYSDLTARFLPENAFPQCSEWEGPPPPHRALITKLLRKRAARGGHRNFTGELFGRALHRMYLRRVLAPNGLSLIRKSMPLLLQAGCLGYHPALFLASVLFQTGLGVRRDQCKAFVEQIRLTDENVLKQQTKENDDLFMWLRFQAKQGVSSAQHAVSRMLFWGQQGISSNLEVAVKFYEKGAEQQKDPVMMYDYGVILLRGQGVKRDVPKALEYLGKAADMDFVPALNSLGWYYEQYEENYQKAAEFWERADELGNPEAPFNLGILHLHGLYPGKPKNMSAAYRYYLKSATRGHIDAAVHVSACWIQGVPGVVSRLPHDAVLWTKWVGEQNGYLGAVLRKALDNYLDQSWSAALLYYLQAAEMGMEIGQFNAAFICELDPEGLVTHYLQIDCEWKYYNLSALSERPPAHAQIKMGDLYYTPHVRRKRDVQAAVQMYAAAALQREPQGLYNLGVLMEEGVSLPNSTLRRLGFNTSVCANNFTIMIELYRRCRDHEKEDSYVPCSLALLNAHLLYVWTFHGSVLKCSSAAAIAIVTALGLMTIFGRLQNAARRLQLSV